MNLRKISAGLVGVTLLAGLVACSGDDDDNDGGGGAGGNGSGGQGDDAAAVGDLLDTLATGVIVPGYTDLVDSLGALGGALDDLCAQPSPAGLDAARSAWDTAALAWQRTRPVSVGPAMDRRLMSSVAYPTRPDDVAEVLAGTGPVTPEALADSGASARGLATVELLLFEPDASDTLAAGPAESRRCTYAAAATTLSGEAAQVVLDDWNGEGEAGEAYTDQFVAGMDGDPQKSLSAVVNEVAHALQTLDDQGLRGIAVAEGPDDVPTNQRDGAAGHRVADLEALLDTVQVVIEGPDGDDGLGQLVTARSEETGQRLDDALATAVETVGALPDSIPDTLAAPDDLAAAGDAAAQLKVVVSTEVASLLGVTIGFSDADGDS